MASNSIVLVVDNAGYIWVRKSTTSRGTVIYRNHDNPEFPTDATLREIDEYAVEEGALPGLALIVRESDIKRLVLEKERDELANKVAKVVDIRHYQK